MNRFNRLLIFIACLAPVLGLGAVAMFFCWDTGYHARYWERYRLDGDRMAVEGRFDDAEKSYLLATAEARKLGDTDIRLASTLVLLGETSNKLEKWADAEKCFRQALEILPRAQLDSATENDRTLYQARTQSGLSRALFAQKRMDEAESLAVRALANFSQDAGIATGLDNRSRVILTTALNVLGHIALSKKDWTGAEKFFTRALAVTAGVPVLAVERRNIMAGLNASRKFGKPEEASVKPLHPVSNEVSSLLGKAEQQTASGHLREAKQLFAQALELALKNKEDTNVISSIYANIAAIYTEEGKWMDATREYEKALAHCRPQASQEADRILMAMNSILSEEKDYAALAPFLEKQLAIREKLYGPLDQRTLTSAYDVFHCLRDSRDFRKLWIFTLSLLERYQKAGVTEDKRYEEALALLLPIGAKEDELDRALLILKRENETRQKRYGPDAQLMRPFDYWLGSVYFFKGNYKEAYPYLERSWSKSKGKYLTNLETAQCVRRLAGCLRASGKLQQARSLIEEYFTMVRNSDGDRGLLSIPAIELGIILKLQNNQRESDKCFLWAENKAYELGGRIGTHQAKLLRRVHRYVNEGGVIEPSTIDARN